MAERLFHERVEPAGGLVEHEQVRTRHQGGDEQYLLLVALGVSPHFLGRVEIEAPDQLVAVRGVDPALDPPQEMNCLGPGELPAGTDPAELVRTLLAPIYLRLLVTAEPIDRTTADNAAKVALAAARAGALRSDPA